MDTDCLDDLYNIKESKNQPRLLISGAADPFRKIIYNRYALPSGSVGFSLIRGSLLNIVSSTGGELVIGLVQSGHCRVKTNGMRHAIPPKGGILFLPGDEAFQLMQDVRTFTIRVPAHDERSLRLLARPYRELQQVTRTLPTSSSTDLLRLAIFLSKELDRVPDQSHQARVVAEALVSRTNLVLDDLGFALSGAEESLVAVASLCAEAVLKAPGVKLSVSQLADACMCSTRQLFRALEQVMGVTPHEYVLRRRLHYARSRLFSHEGFDFKSVATQAGFPMTSRFLSALKKSSG